MAVSSLGGATNKNDAGIYTWEKTLQDVNNIDEIFSNSRDMGFLRLNYSRINVIGKLAKYDSVDIYKVNITSRGKLSLSVKSGTTEEKVLDLSAYETKLNELLAISDPDAYLEKMKKSNQEYLNQNLMEVNAPGMKVKVYMKKGNREVLIGDSHADSGTKTRTNMDKILTGNYRASKGEYYIKIERDNTVGSNDEVPYVMQARVGTSHKHDYILTETVSDDTKNKKISTLSSSNGYLTMSDILELQSANNSGLATMFSEAYENIAKLYNKNNKY